MAVNIDDDLEDLLEALRDDKPHAQVKAQDFRDSIYSDLVFKEIPTETPDMESPERWGSW